MAAINFPAASESPWYNPANGITYEYVGNTWRAVNALSNSFDDEYVEVTGDNMTGNLTLGADELNSEITLKTDGSAEFAGGDAFFGADGALVTETPYVIFGGAAETSKNSFLYNAGTISLYPSATTVDPAIRGFKHDDHSTETFRIAKDGSATFAGDVTQVNNSFTVDSSRTNAAFKHINVVSDVFGDAAIQDGSVFSVVSSGSVVTSGGVIVGGDQTITGSVAHIDADGSAEFAGDVEIGDFAGNNGAKIYSWGETDIRGTVTCQNVTGGADCFIGSNNDPSGRVFQGKNRATNEVTSEIAADGSAEFAGTVRVPFISLNAPNAYLQPNHNVIFFEREDGNWGNVGAKFGSILARTGNDNAASIDIIRGDVSHGNSSDIVFNTHAGGAGNPTEMARFKHDGSATFAGTITTQGGAGGPYVAIGDTITFNTEADNPANYTTTTDSEGNETQVYSGPTLDVKERLTKADTALQTLKTAAAAALDFAELKAAIATALADI